MIISLVVAMEENRGIGQDNRLPWHLSADLRLFKQHTIGHHLIMGRKTYDSIGKPLPGRTTIVLTRNLAFYLDGVLIAHSLNEALSLARQAGETEAFIIGGGEIFAQALPMADRIYLTRVHAQVFCDTFFPKLDPTDWEIRQEFYQPANEKNDYPFTFQLLERT